MASPTPGGDGGQPERAAAALGRVRFGGQEEAEAPGSAGSSGTSSGSAEASGPSGGPEAAVAKVLSSKTLNTQASKNVLGLANVMPTLFKLLQFKTYKAFYTIEEIEAKLYDIQHHDGGTRLLQQKGIISLDDDDQDEDSGRSPVIRCFTDVRAKYAAILLLVSVFVTFIVTPMTFVYGGSWSSTEGSGTSFVAMRFVIGVDIVMDLIYAGFLILQLNMSFMHLKRRVEVTGREKILRRWLMSPLYYVQWLSTTTYIWIIGCGAPLLINNIKFVRVVHWQIFPDPLWLFEESRVVRLGRLLFLLLGCSHWVACVLFWGGGFREELESLGDNAPLLRFNGQELPNTGHIRLYLMALVESIYMMTGALDNPLGDGSARENNLASLIIVSVFGPIGMVIVAILIAAVVREQALQFALEIRHEENMAFVTRALENLNIPEQLQRRVVSLHYFQKMSHDTEAFSQLFNKNNLSGPLEDAIRVYLYHKVLSSRFFQSGGPNYLLAVVRVLEDRMFLPGDYVARRGEVGAEMFFINRGELSVLVPGNGSEDIAHAVLIPGRKLKKGDYFGDVALVKRSLRTAWVRAETYVIVSVLHRHCIEDIWEFFPQEREALVSRVSETIERDKQRENKKRWQDAIKDVTSEKEKEKERADAAGRQGSGSVLIPTTRASIPSALASRASRCSSGSYPSPMVASVATVASLAMARKVSEDAHADGAWIAADFRALREQGEEHHSEAMRVAERQCQRLEALEQQVAALASQLGAAQRGEAPAKAHSDKSHRKKHLAHGGQVQQLDKEVQVALKVPNSRLEGKAEPSREWIPIVISDSPQTTASSPRSPRGGAVPRSPRGGGGAHLALPVQRVQPAGSANRRLSSLEQVLASYDATADAAALKE